MHRRWRGEPIAAVATLLAAGLCGANPTEDSPPSADTTMERGKPRPRSHIDSAAARFTFFHQEGSGYQSQAGDVPGDEQLFVYQPMGAIGIQTGRKLHTDLVFALDVVSAASPDALDATSSASKWTEAADLTATHAYAVTDKDTLQFRYGPHAEEHWWGGNAAVAYLRSLADDNATVVVDANVIGDRFDDLRINGADLGELGRWTFNGNLSVTQLLSPTTVGALTYGATYQTGRLETTWNSVPLDPTDAGSPRLDRVVLGRTREIFPDSRLRHAFAGELRQHIPVSHTTLAAHYRYYLDDFSLRAHTASLTVYQYLQRSVYVRVGYRFHHQTGVDFFTRQVRGTSFVEGTPVTADSDLDSFVAHDLSGGLVLYIRDPRSAEGKPQFVDVGYRTYWRTNALSVDVVSVGYGGRF